MHWTLWTMSCQCREWSYIIVSISYLVFVHFTFYRLESGMKPILCIGETKDEYDLKIKNEVCAMQLSKDLLGVTKEQMAVRKL
jgi:predicted permease